jgi:hypothetical protein
MMSTTGESFILTLRASSAVLDVLQTLALESPLFVVLAGKGLDHANRREDLSDHRDQLALLLLTSRDAFLMRRVKAYTTRNSTGATASEIRVNRQFRYSMTR